jgi:ELWxxDGT repeat protein
LTHRAEAAADGSVQGTSELVRHGSSFEPDDLTVFGNKVLFNSFDASDRINLWVTDGTAAGTSLLTVANIDTNEFDEGLSPRHFFAFGSEVLFAGDGPDRLTGLWVTDGTGAGTRRFPSPARILRGLAWNRADSPFSAARYCLTAPMRSPSRTYG